MSVQAIMKQTALILILGFVIASPLLADDSSAGTTIAVVNTNSAANTNSAEVSTNQAPFFNDQQRASYALGMLMSHRWQQQGVDLNLDLVARGMKDEQDGKALLTPEQVQAALDVYNKEIAANQQRIREEMAAENKRKGEQFLAENKKKSDVKTLPSGLEYKIISEGKGKKPSTNDVVRVNYRGTLLDGTQFDATPGEPRDFPLFGGIIQGWKQALPLMPAGSVWEIYIPSDLAYGEAGRPPQIPPNATLVFTIQLISSAPPGKPQPGGPSAAPLTSDIIAVPSAAELKKGKQPYTIKADQLPKMQTNSVPTR